MWSGENQDLVNLARLEKTQEKALEYKVTLCANGLKVSARGFQYLIA